MKTCCIDITIARDIGLMNRMPSSIPIDTAASAYGLNHTGDKSSYQTQKDPR
jgi:hypothetical protein